MKKRLIKTCFIAVFFIISCSKNEKLGNEAVHLKVSNFNKIGEIHNSFLTNVKDNFKTINSITNNREKIGAIYEFNKKFVSSLNISNTEKNILVANLEKNKSFVKEDILIAKSFGNSFSKKTYENEENLFEKIDNLKKDEIINDNSYQILNSLSNDLKANYNGILSDSHLKTNVQLLINEFNSIGYSKDSEGEMVGVVLAISIASIEWWEQNPDALGTLASKNSTSNKALIVPWLAADLVGGAVSSVVAIGGQAAINGEINWGTVGWSALGGAVSGSTGAVGKIAKWLF